MFQQISFFAAIFLSWCKDNAVMEYYFILYDRSFTSLSYTAAKINNYISIILR